MLMISYIQPFEDGNKRASRLLGNAVLLSADIVRFLTEASTKPITKKRLFFLRAKQRQILQRVIY